MMSIGDVVWVYVNDTGDGPEVEGVYATLEAAIGTCTKGFKRIADGVYRYRYGEYPSNKTTIVRKTIRDARG